VCDDDNDSKWTRPLIDVDERARDEIEREREKEKMSKYKVDDELEIKINDIPDIFLSWCSTALPHVSHAAH
jgi:hypothetical protein